MSRIARLSNSKTRLHIMLPWQPIPIVLVANRFTSKNAGQDRMLMAAILAAEVVCVVAAAETRAAQEAKDAVDLPRTVDVVDSPLVEDLVP